MDAYIFINYIYIYIYIFSFVYIHSYFLYFKDRGYSPLVAACPVYTCHSAKCVAALSVAVWKDSGQCVAALSVSTKTLDL